MDAKSGVYCEICNVCLSSLNLLDAHQVGKKHRKKVNELENAFALGRRSVYVSGLPLKTFTSQQQIENFMKVFGEVEKVHFDISKGSYAIIDYFKDESAAMAISKGQISIGKHTATIKKRQTDFKMKPEKYNRSALDTNELIVKISHHNSFLYQIDALIKLFALNSQQINERKSYGDVLTNELSNYVFGARVFVFGSSTTDVGTVDSDLDASICFEDSIKDVAILQFRNKHTLLTSEPKYFLQQKICSEEYNRLTRADGIRLLNKILNDIRQQGTLPISDQYPIIDAKCPIVRFFYDKNIIVDLSVNNNLGIAKTCFIRGILCSDSSGNIRRLILAFRFWLTHHKLMHNGDGRDSHTKHYFNSYNMTMLCIVFLQSRSLIRVQFAAKKHLIDGWNVNYDYASNDLHEKNIAALFKDFFIWFTQLQFKGMVLRPHSATMISVEDLEEKCKLANSKESFKYSYLNLQDPLEFSHNITQLISEKYIAEVRSKMLNNLRQAKHSHDNYLAYLKLIPKRAVVPQREMFIVLECNKQTIQNCNKMVYRILSELLLVEETSDPPPPPPSKKYRLDDNSENTMKPMLHLQIKYEAWKGRRSIRRSLKNLSLDPWDVEKEISSRNSLKLLKEPINFKINVYPQDHNVCYQFSFISGDKYQFEIFFHYLETFVPKFFNYLCDSMKCEEDRMEIG